MRLAVLLALPTIVLLAACDASDLPPFETAPLAASAGDATPRVGFCYNRDTATPTEILALARKACSPGTSPRFVSNRLSPTACPILTPSRVTFACEPVAR
jgi:hypothetical protein